MNVHVPWHWRWLGFDSASVRGVLYVPHTLTFNDPDEDAFLAELIKAMTAPIVDRTPVPMSPPFRLTGPSRWFRFKRFAGFDSVKDRYRRGGVLPPTDRSLVPILLRGRP